MNAKDAIRYALTSTQQLLGWYLSDLSDAELLERPAPAANHIAWQLGHLIQSEVALVRGTVPDAAYPELPAGFAEQHGKEAAQMEPPRGFASKQQYLELFNKVRSTTMSLLDRLSESDLDRPTQGPPAQFAPRLGELLLLIAQHTLMHAGQFTVLRRKLGKPILF